jgi:hypothetical protein
MVEYPGNRRRVLGVRAEAAMAEGMLAILPDATITGPVEAHIGPNWAVAKG